MESEDKNCSMYVEQWQWERAKAWTKCHKEGQILDAESWTLAGHSCTLGGKGDFEHNDLNHRTGHYILMINQHTANNLKT